MINLKPVTWDNHSQIISMEVHENQKNFVAKNVKSLAQAYARWIGCGRPPLTFGIYNKEDLVGFAMVDYETAEETDIKEPCYFLWRYMIDKNHQGKGYGKAALQQVINLVRTRPMGEAAWFYTSVVPENVVAHKLYNDSGFVETGDISGGEIVLRLAI